MRKSPVAASSPPLPGTADQHTPPFDPPRLEAHDFSKLCRATGGITSGPPQTP